MDHRLSLRIPVEPQCRAQLRLDQDPVHDLPVVNLSASGCCLDLPPDLASRLLGRTFLDDLRLSHPSIPRGFVKGRIMWVHGPRTPGGPAAGMGVQFTDTPMGFGADVARFVETWARYEANRSDFGGMPA